MKHYLVKYRSDGNITENEQLYVGPCHEFSRQQNLSAKQMRQVNLNLISNHKGWTNC